MAQNIINENGLVKPSLSECMQRIGDALESTIGLVNREADSVTGQWIGVEAEANAIHFEALENLWASRFLSTASGSALDAIGTWFGLSRKGQSATRVNAAIIGVESKTVPAGAQAGFGNAQFSLDADTIISRSDLLIGSIRITSAAQPDYTVRINGVDYRYTRKTTDTINDIAAGVANAIKSSMLFNAAAEGAVVTLTSSSLVEGHPVSIYGDISWVSIGSPAVFTAIEKGALVVPVGGLNVPVSAIDGWTGVANLVPGATGSDRESDGDYRRRLVNSRQSSSGVATVSAIESRLLSDIDGVTMAHVIENLSMQTVNGMPPKSIQVVVSGGLEQDIANAIWRCKGAGIETYGTIKLTAYDRHGRPHNVEFSRPGEIMLYVRVEVELLDQEEQITRNVITAIRQGVANYAATLSLGNDVITQRIYGYVYGNTSGIGKMKITVSQDRKNFSEDNIVVPESSVITLSTDDVEVTGV